MLPIAFSDRYIFPLPNGHRFPIQKYEIVYEKLCYEGLLLPDKIIPHALIEDEHVIAVHCPDYWKDLNHYRLDDKAIRKIGFPMSEDLLLRTKTSTKGTLNTSIKALENGCGINLGGGYHHAYYDHGEAFCVINDLVITANYLLINGLAKKVMIVDLDVHQGNGTAALCKNNSNIFTFSIHGESNYPTQKEIGDFDLSLPKYTNDDEYLNALKTSLPIYINSFKPDFILYQAGVDVLKTDKLGTLNLSKSACLERDKVLFNIANQKQIPISITLGGGYSTKIADVVDAHCNTIRKAFEMFD